MAARWRSQDRGCEPLDERPLNYEEPLSVENASISALPLLLHNLGTQLKSNTAYIFFYSDDTTKKSMRYEWMSAEFCGPQSALPLLYDVDTWREDKPGLEDRLIIEENWQPEKSSEGAKVFLEAFGLKSWIAAPFVIQTGQSAIRGFIGVNNVIPRKWGTEDIKACLDSANILSSAFTRFSISPRDLENTLFGAVVYNKFSGTLKIDTFEPEDYQTSMKRRQLKFNFNSAVPLISDSPKKLYQIEVLLISAEPLLLPESSNDYRPISIVPSPMSSPLASPMPYPDLSAISSVTVPCIYHPVLHNRMEKEISRIAALLKASASKNQENLSFQACYDLRKATLEEFTGSVRLIREKRRRKMDGKKSKSATKLEMEKEDIILLHLILGTREDGYVVFEDGFGGFELVSPTQLSTVLFEELALCTDSTSSPKVSSKKRGREQIERTNKLKVVLFLSSNYSATVARDIERQYHQIGPESLTFQIIAIDGSLPEELLASYTESFYSAFLEPSNRCDANQAWNSAKDFLSFSPKFDCFRTRIKYAEIESSASSSDEMLKLPNLCDIEEITEKFICLNLNGKSRDTLKDSRQQLETRVEIPITLKEHRIKDLWAESEDEFMYSWPYTEGLLDRGEVISDVIKAYSSNLRVVCLYGAVGVGKTECAKKVGEWLKENRDISTAVWCGANPTNCSADYLQNTAVAFELDCLYLSEEETGREISAHMNRYSSRKVLVCLDGYDIMERGLASTLFNFFTKIPNFLVLVTSVCPLTLEGTTESLTVKNIEVPPLDKNDSLKLFMRILKSSNADTTEIQENESEMEELLKWLWGYPLAIKSVVSKLRYMSLADIKKDLHEKPSNVLSGVTDLIQSDSDYWQSLQGCFKTMPIESQKLFKALVNGKDDHRTRSDGLLIVDETSLGTDEAALQSVRTLMNHGFLRRTEQWDEYGAEESVYCIYPLMYLVVKFL